MSRSEAQPGAGPTEITDAQLVALALANDDRRAFSELIRRHQSRVRNWLRQLCGDRSLGEDLAQESFMRAWDRLRLLKDREKFRTWLMQIAYREFLQAQRRRASQKRLLDALQREPAELTAAGSPSVDLQRVLACASVEERASLVLCYAHGFSHSEIADLLDMPLGTIKSHIARGKLRIQAQFGQEGEP